jgi:hypothetical protein
VEKVSVDIAREPLRVRCFPQLHFLSAREGDSFSVWKRATREAIEILNDRINEAMPRIKKDEIALSPVYAAFSVLAILISEKFEACLQALVNDKWDSMDQLFQEEKQYCLLEESINWEEYRPTIITYICRCLGLNWETFYSCWGALPVRELERWEKKIYCEEIGLLPRSPVQDSENRWERYEIAHQRLQLSIDLFVPLEVISEQVKSIVKQKQDAFLEGIKRDWDPELQGGVIDQDFINKDILHTKLRFDFKRGIKQDKRTRVVSTFETWHVALRTYYLRYRKGEKPREIAQQKWFPHHDEDQIYNKLNKYKKRAKKIIGAALLNIPLSVVNIP